MKKKNNINIEINNMKNLINEITFKGKDIEKLYQIFASHQSLCGNFSSNKDVTIFLVDVLP